MGRDRPQLRHARDRAHRLHARVGPGAPHLAVLPTAPEVAAADITVLESAAALALRTAALHLTVALGAHPHLTISRADGTTIVEDAASGGLGRDADGRLCWDLALAAGERVFGGGQRTGPVDKRDGD